MLISGDADGYVRDWRVPPPGLLTGSPVNSVAYSPGGGTLAVGDGDLQLWNPATHTLTASASVRRLHRQLRQRGGLLSRAGT